MTSGATTCLFKSESLHQIDLSCSSSVPYKHPTTRTLRFILSPAMCYNIILQYLCDKRYSVFDAMLSIEQPAAAASLSVNSIITWIYSQKPWSKYDLHIDTHKNSRHTSTNVITLTPLIQALRHQDVIHKPAGTFASPRWAHFCPTQQCPLQLKTHSPTRKGTAITQVKSSHRMTGRMPTQGQYNWNQHIRRTRSHHHHQHPYSARYTRRNTVG